MNGTILISMWLPRQVTWFGGEGGGRAVMGPTLEFQRLLPTSCVTS